MKRPTASRVPTWAINKNRVARLRDRGIQFEGGKYGWRMTIRVGNQSYLVLSSGGRTPVVLKRTDEVSPQTGRLMNAGVPTKQEAIHVMDYLRKLWGKRPIK